MAEVVVENLPPKEGGEVSAEKPKKKSGANPFIPIIIVVVLAPLLSYVTTSFLLVPKIKQAVAGTSPQAEAAIAPAKEEHAVSDGVKYKYEFENIVANLNGALHSRYIKVSFTLEGSDPEFVDKMGVNKAKIIDATIGALTSLSVKDLEQPGVRNMLRTDLLSAYEKALNTDIIEQLYFSEFVVQ